MALQPSEAPHGNTLSSVEQLHPSVEEPLPSGVSKPRTHPTRHSAQGAKATQSQTLEKWNSWKLIGLVALGGVIGSLLRYAVTLGFSKEYSFIATLIVNIIGSFILGFLLEALAKRGPETPRQQQIRLLIGTGICGGFTTYSTFALNLNHLFAASLIAPHFLIVAVLYLVGTLVFGTIAAILGVALAAKLPQGNAIVPKAGDAQ